MLDNAFEAHKFCNMHLFAFVALVDFCCTSQLFCFIYNGKSHLPSNKPCWRLTFLPPGLTLNFEVKSLTVTTLFHFGN